ncbi:hypothetical protein RclHR1_01740029 [Rhizophagus clarus]|uniref:BACK domain-containing protein n=1 Tax=Rhizophagus clarus TaxID=94130 RepID=A0A2Z6QP09_9GLOM|nr:hypothetical protein RclHR1_01740029 [Rhizophagus clarus]
MGKNLEHIRKPSIKTILKTVGVIYIYSGELELEEHLEEDILGLLVASDELNLDEFFEPVQYYLTKNRTTWIQENFDLRDDLQIDEIDSWDCLIKWGIEQTPGLNSDITKWNNEDCEALKKTLDQYFSLIRFVDFSHSDYFNKIQSYKVIIPNNIYEKIEVFHTKGTLPKTITSPPRNCIESDIIKPKFISGIINWIDKKDKDYIRSYNDTSYKFKLIHLGSEDGMDNESFSNKFTSSLRKKCIQNSC